MPTQIMNIPVLVVSMVTSDNEDLIEHIDFTALDGITALAITGIAFRMQVRQNRPDPAALIEASTTDNSLALDVAITNRLWFQVPLATVRKLQVGVYVFDIVGTADGRTRVLVEGTLQVQKGVTR